MTLRAAVVTCSDSVAAGRADDRSGPVALAALADLGMTVAGIVVVPDDRHRIVEAVRQALAKGARVVVCTGGTGLGPRDVTPEALASIATRQIPGFGEAIRTASRDRVPTTDLSRAGGVMVADSVVLALPGSTGGVRDGLAAVGPLLEHAIAMARGEGHVHGHQETGPEPAPGLVDQAPIDLDAMTRAMDDPAAGAVVTFAGRVRDHDHGRPVTGLTYEGHPDAAEVLAKVVAEAKARPGVLDAAARHRLGDLRIGDLAFAVAVSAAHRREAFETCSWLVDEAKSRLPIWKLQLFADGTREWVNCP